MLSSAVPLACALASKSDVSAILNAPVTATSQSQGHACAFKSLAGTSVLVTVRASASAAAAHADLERKSSAFAALLSEPVNPVVGIGDEAGAVLDYLYVRRANVVYTIFISDAPTVADHRAWTLSLARLVLRNAQAAARRVR